MRNPEALRSTQTDPVKLSSDTGSQNENAETQSDAEELGDEMEVFSVAYIRKLLNRLIFFLSFFFPFLLSLFLSFFLPFFSSEFQ